MGKKVVFIESNSNDPRFNLALEQYVTKCQRTESISGYGRIIIPSL